MKTKNKKMLSTLVLLPMAYGLVAPSAAFAQEVPASAQYQENIDNVTIDLEKTMEKKTVVSSESVPFQTRVITDTSLPEGTEIVEQEGTEGIKEQYLSTSPTIKSDGSPSTIKVNHEKVTTLPKDRVIRKGAADNVVKSVDSDVIALETQKKIDAREAAEAEKKREEEARKAEIAKKEAEIKAEKERIEKEKAAKKAEAQRKIEEQLAKEAAEAKAEQEREEEQKSAESTPVESADPTPSVSATPTPTPTPTPSKTSTPKPAAVERTSESSTTQKTAAPKKTVNPTPKASKKSVSKPKQTYSAPVVSGNAMSPSQAKAYAKKYILDTYGWGERDYQALVKLWNRESGWNYKAANPASSARGIPQAMVTIHFGGYNTPAAREYMNSVPVQVAWGTKYINGRYGSPSAALAHSDAVGWY